MLSYSQALDRGLDPIQYRTDFLDSLEVGSHTVVVDGVVWARHKPAAIALLRNQSGDRLAVVKVKKVTANGLPYGGLTEFTIGELATLIVEKGARNNHKGYLTKIAT
ncbi:hypothetical protein [Thioclava sp. GXIMD2076]|uniref:hypothetical protein n=1 Tax=Thioclava sp. GXIMD2076 TaxID=3131931 RepID=UPI0030CC324B